MLAAAVAVARAESLKEAPPPGVTLVVSAVPIPDGGDSAQACLRGFAPLLVDAGGTRIRRLRAVRSGQGGPTAMLLVADLPSEASVAALFDSDAYRALIPQRDKGFTEMNISIAIESGSVSSEAELAPWVGRGLAFASGQPQRRLRRPVSSHPVGSRGPGAESARPGRDGAGGSAG